MDTQALINLYFYYRDMQEDAFNNYDDVAYRMFTLLAKRIEELIDWDFV